MQVEDVRTFNMEGKKRKVAKPDYKKAYITLKSPLPISSDLFPIPWVKEAMEKKLLGKKNKSNKPSVVDPKHQEKTPSHWLHDDHLEQRRRRETIAARSAAAEAGTMEATTRRRRSKSSIRRPRQQRRPNFHRAACRPHPLIRGDSLLHFISDN